MSFKLKEAVFRVRCREPGCPFNAEFIVKENIMGATEADIDSEALKLARNLGYIKHDAVFGRKHPLANPDVNKISGSYERIGVAPEPLAAHAGGGAGAAAAGGAGTGAFPTRTYRRGETIIRKGESAATVVEVQRGMAYNVRHPEFPYKAGSTFGAAALFRQKSRLADVVAGEDGTTVTFYNIRELSKTNPTKARDLYDEAMEDVFHILVHLEEYSLKLEKKIQRLEEGARAAKARPVPARKGAPKKSAPKKQKKAPAKKAKKAASGKKPAGKKKPSASKKKARR
jgi:hypothetical protein